MESMVIERVALEHIEKLQEIGRATFLEAFGHLNSAQDMQQYIEQSFSTAKLSNEIQNKGSQFYFAIINTRIIGYLKINFGAAQTEPQDDSLEIERIYVLKEFHGQKIGQILYQKAVEIALKMKVSYVWLGVWEENHRALAFYRKNGFTTFDKHIFMLGNDEQTDLMMKKKLSAISE